MSKVVAVTGALGFIGGHLVTLLLQRGYHVYTIDAETYAANLGLLTEWDDHIERGYLKYVCKDICTLANLPDVDAVLNLAAETHVDNSIMDARRFVQTNVHGVFNLLELVRAKRNYEMPRFVQISTDEVYGSVGEGATDETAPLAPSSPYAASKAAADLLVQSYGITYGVSYNIVRPSNCYGTGQYPEKLIPKTVRCFTLGKAMPIHGVGAQKRSWLDVDDCAAAILTVLEQAPPRGIYNVGGNTEADVRSIVERISDLLARGNYTLGFERLGVDARYHVEDSKLRALGWRPQGDLWRDLPSLVASEAATFRW